ncbi:MAG TPA: ABC transporter permease [Chloroflexia bacterium]|jgi:peptide/nickel transport system permease protein
MITYIIRRLIQNVLTVLGIVSVLWSVQVYLASGGISRDYPSARGGIVKVYQYIQGQIEQRATEMDSIAPELREGTGTRWNRLRIEKSRLERDKRYIEQQYSIDKPWPFSFFASLFDPSDTSYYHPILDKEVPYGIDVWLGSLHITGSGLLTGDWGASRVPDPGFNSSVRGNWGSTILLLALTLILSVILAIPLGVLAAVRQRTKTDHALVFFTSLSLSTPPFITGFMLILFLGIIPYKLHTNNGWTWLPYLPVGRANSLDRSDLLDFVYHLTLPLFCMVVIVSPNLIRYVRSSMLDVMGKDYIRTARAKGAKPSKILFRHALRNASMPLITAIGFSLPFIITSLGIVEYVFGYPGVASYLIDSVRGGSAPAILQAVTVAVATISLLNMLADITYTIIDPRVSYNKV